MAALPSEKWAIPAPRCVPVPGTCLPDRTARKGEKRGPGQGEAGQARLGQVSEAGTPGHAVLGARALLRRHEGHPTPGPPPTPIGGAPTEAEPTETRQALTTARAIRNEGHLRGRPSRGDTPRGPGASGDEGVR